MIKRTVLILFLISAFVISGLAKSSAQELGTTPQEKAQLESVEPEPDWVWGEVINLDPQNKVILLKYLDYETDQEKEMKVTVDENTTYESIKSIEDLKQNDPISIDYILTPEGINVAKHITLERPEEPDIVLPKEAEIVPSKLTEGNEVGAPRMRFNAETGEPINDETFNNESGWGLPESSVDEPAIPR